MTPIELVNEICLLNDNLNRETITQLIVDHDKKVRDDQTQTCVNILEQKEMASAANELRPLLPRDIL